MRIEREDVLSHVQSLIVIRPILEKQAVIYDRGVACFQMFAFDYALNHRIRENVI